MSRKSFMKWGEPHKIIISSISIIESPDWSSIDRSWASLRLWIRFWVYRPQLWPHGVRDDSANQFLLREPAEQDWPMDTKKLPLHVKLRREAIRAWWRRWLLMVQTLISTVRQVRRPHTSPPKAHSVITKILLEAGAGVTSRTWAAGPPPFNAANTGRQGSRFWCSSIEAPA
jgi:hypothetical protein